MQLVVGGAASATVATATEAQVFRLQREAFDALCDTAPALRDAFARVAARRLQRRQMLAVLPAMFGALDAADAGFARTPDHLAHAAPRRAAVSARATAATPGTW